MTTTTPSPHAAEDAHVLFVCHPLTGHITPALRVAAELRRRGWRVSFLGPTAHRARIAAAGVDFVPLEGDADLDDLAYYSPESPTPPVPGYHSLPWQQRALVDLEKHCFEPIPAQWACVKRALARLRAATPSRRVVIVSEAFFHGILPLHLGAPLDDDDDDTNTTSRPKTLCLSVTPPAIRSIDLPPFGYALPFAHDAAGRARNARMWAEFAADTAPLARLLRARLADAGATQPLDPPDRPVLDGLNYTAHDAILQIGAPAFEYPRCDWPRAFRFVGFLPLAAAPAGGYANLPAWWDEVTTAAAKIVVVAQGTVETDPHDLIIPTMEALRDASNVLVVGILGRRGAALPPDYRAPANARVADYLHYDAVLRHASAWVHNGGYGAVTHGVAHAVPMVVAGEGQDKPENARRVRLAGIGVALGSARPGVRDLRIALEAVLRDDGRYRLRVDALRRQSEALDCFGSVERAVVDALRQ